MEKEAVLKRCPKKDKKPGKNWCLYDSKGKRLLGRHPTKEDAMKQERAVHARKGSQNDIEKAAVSPPGWGGTVEKMKKHPEIENPFALAWAMHERGFKPHYPEKKSSKQAGVVPGVPDGTGPMGGTSACPMSGKIVLMKGNGNPEDDIVLVKEAELDEKEAVSPPGWSGTTKAMKKHKEITNPWALSWWMAKQKPGAKWGPGGK